MLKSMRKSKNRYFYHIFVSRGDPPGTITLNVVWMEREFDAYKLSRSMYPSIFNSFPVIRTEGGPIWIKFRRPVQNDMSTALIWSKYVEFQYRGRLGEVNGMSSQSHLPHCRVQSPGEINVMMHATLQGVRIPPAILKIVFAVFYFILFLMQFRL